MRDADRICEQAPGSGQTLGTVVMTLAAVVGVCGVFAMGYSIGRRVERLVPCVAPETEPQKARQVTELLDFERLGDGELTFYDTLMASDGETSRSRAVKAKPVVKPAPVAKAAATTTPASVNKATFKTAPTASNARAEGSFTLQVSSVRRRDEAQALATAMTRQGLRPYITSATLDDKGTWYRVRVGRYDSVGQANAAKAQLTRADIPARVMRTD